MISVAEALAHVFALSPVLPCEEVALSDAAGRVLRRPVIAARDQPPFPASAMDGYAVAASSGHGPLKVIGEAAAGGAFDGALKPGEAVRIFTGAPVPTGADCVIIQEDVAVSSDTVTLRETPRTGLNIRRQALDFRAHDSLSAPRRLGPVDLALIAAMNCPRVVVSRRPEVALIMTGDELVLPGEEPRADQIIASNAFAIKAIAEAEGAVARILPVARDTEASLRAVFELASGADMVITIGGASIGAHDLVGPVARAMGATQAFYKIAMRPGKPLMAGQLRRSMLLGLPGNPVSSIVCAHIFMRPALRAMLGLGAHPLPTATASLGADLPTNGPRTHYMRARLSPGPTITPLPDQDSALLSVLAEADALLIQPAHDPGRNKGEEIRYIPFHPA